MSTATTSDLVDRPGGSPLPFDLFREVHKGLRHALFGLTTFVGAADCESVAERDAVVDRVHALIALLHAHHGHEDTFVQPLLVAHDATLAAIIDAGHAETENDIVDIELRTEKLAGAEGGEAVVLGLELYHALALFTARYLAHMALEEGGVMSTLRQAMTVDELLDVETSLRGAVAPPMMCAFITMMLPAMNVVERADMLGGMHAGAPPEIFELFRAAAEAALSPADYRALAGRIGLA